MRSIVVLLLFSDLPPFIFIFFISFNISIISLRAAAPAKLRFLSKFSLNLIFVRYMALSLKLALSTLCLKSVLFSTTKKVASLFLHINS